MSTGPIRIVDLFAGAGGLTAGFHEASPRFETVAAVEADLHAAASFAATFGSHVVHQMTIRDWLDNAEMPSDIDVVVGGPPCQGFSRLNRREEADDRNGLWSDYVDTIVRLQPRYFVMENVAAFQKAAEFSAFQRETLRRGRLSDYTYEALVLNAADYGAPQARKRTVVIGHRRDLDFPGWPTPTHSDKPVTVSDAIRRVMKQPLTELPARSFVFKGKSLPGPYVARELHVGRDYTKLSLDRFATIPPGGNRFDLPEELLAPCWRKHRSGSGDVMGRLHWDRPSVTIRTEFFKPEKGRYLHPELNRAITHLEAALLQGFGANHKFVGSRVSIARQIGNAVPVPLARAIAGQILSRF